VAKAGRSFRLLYIRIEGNYCISGSRVIFSIFSGTGYTSPTSPGKDEEKKNERDNEE
jgi:hypothetical protein